MGATGECGSDGAQRVDYDQYFSWQARNLKNSILAEMFQKFNLTNDAIILHAGLPPAESFPFLSLTANTPHTPVELPSTAAPLQQTNASTAQGSPASSQQQAATIPVQAPTMQISLTGQMMNDAQQYMFHAGHPPLLRWARNMAAMQHHAPNPIDCAMSSGAVDAITAAVSCLLDPGDYILCEEFTYPHAPQCTFIPRRLNMLPVAMDEQGMRPESLRHVLATTPPSPVTGRPPRVAYIIPAGQNPTGAIMTTERKREIYQICREHGIIILEDDAYYWLQYPQGGRVPEAQQPGLQLPASFLSMDVDSRVLRIDTFAKLLGPGFRLGWITGAPQLVSKVGHSIQAGSCGPSSLSQVVVSQLLEGWGRDGFEAFIKQQQALYARRADAVCAAAQRHLRGLASWEDPRAGMFMWFRLTGLADVDERLVNQLVVQRVAVVPGKPFWADLAAQAAGAPCPYFRIAFSCVPEDRIDEAFSRLATAIRAAMADTSIGGAPLAPVPSGSGHCATDVDTADEGSSLVEGFPLGSDADVEGMLSLRPASEETDEQLLLLQGKQLFPGKPTASYASSRCSVLSAGQALSRGGKARSTRSEASGTSSGPDEEIEVAV